MLYQKKTLTLTYWNVIKHFTFTFLTRRSAIDFTCFHIIDEMFLKSMSTETSRRRTYIFAINTISIAPCYIQSVFPGFTDSSFELLKFLLIHHFTSVCVSDYIIILDIGINMLCCLIIHYYSIHSSFVILYSKMNRFKYYKITIKLIQCHCQCDCL